MVFSNFDDQFSFFSVKVDDVSKALESVEKRILSKPKKPEFVRPWFSPIEPLAETIDKRIVYPSDCEDCGMGKP